MKSILLLLVLFFSLGGCSHERISKQSLQLVDRSVTYPAVRENPDEFTGKYVQVGGIIAAARNFPSGGELEIVELPLSSSGKPDTAANSEGRFLARGDRFLDPLIFKRGLLVSLVGEVRGHRVGTLDNLEYRYPLIRIQEIHLWKPEDIQPEASPRFHFGIGVFKGF